jgi:hypothetical protein
VKPIACRTFLTFCIHLAQCCALMSFLFGPILLCKLWSFDITGSASQSLQYQHQLAPSLLTILSHLYTRVSNTSMTVPSDQAQSCRNFQLALLFLAETKKGRDSAWYPYIQTLPQHVDSLVHWSDTELHELQYGATEPEQQFLQEVC